MQKFYYIFNSYFTFKPYYKWITFNTLFIFQDVWQLLVMGFKPYYKWITFNTENKYYWIRQKTGVLNLIINGLPSIQNIKNIESADYVLF